MTSTSPGSPACGRTRASASTMGSRLTASLYVGTQTRKRSGGEATAAYYERVMLRNGQIADLFDLLGDLYEIDGANVYRVLAYHRAATRMRESAESIWELSEQGRLTELSGIGGTIAGKVDELRASGTMVGLEKLRAKYPDSLVDVKRMPGIGAKSARRFFDELGVRTLQDLETAAREDRIRELKGFSKTTEERILEQIAAGATPRKALLLLEK